MPLNPYIKFSPDILDPTKVAMKPTREGFGMITALIIVAIAAVFIGGGWYAEKNGFIPSLSNRQRADKVIITRVKNKIAWIENFYTANAYYPSVEDFQNQFPDSTTVEEYAAPATGWVYGHYHGNNDFDKDWPQSFVFSYRLSRAGKPPLYALGYAQMTNSFAPPYFTGRYLIYPCPRWHDLGLQKPLPSYDPLSVDFNSGKVMYRDTVLLSGLAKPRIFAVVGEHRPWDNNSVVKNQKVKIFLTSGNDVFSYDYDVNNKEILKNPKKIGEVPGQCPESYLNQPYKSDY